jgi:hypothetical protein
MNLVYRSQKYFAPVGERFRDFARSYGAERLGGVPPAPAEPRALAGGTKGRATRRGGR